MFTLPARCADGTTNAAAKCLNAAGRWTQIGADVSNGIIQMGGKTRAVKGHEFGVDLSTQEKAALIAFLNTLG